MVADPELRIVLDAMCDAVQYRWQLAGSCPADCMSRGEVCDECAEHQHAAEAYEALSGRLTAAMDGPPPRDETVVKVVGNLL